LAGNGSPRPPACNRVDPVALKPDLVGRDRSSPLGPRTGNVVPPAAFKALAAGPTKPAMKVPSRRPPTPDDQSTRFFSTKPKTKNNRPAADEIRRRGDELFPISTTDKSRLWGRRRLADAKPVPNPGNWSQYLKPRRDWRNGSGAISKGRPCSLVARNRTGPIFWVISAFLFLFFSRRPHDCCAGPIPLFKPCQSLWRPGKTVKLADRPRVAKPFWWVVGMAARPPCGRALESCIPVGKLCGAGKESPICRGPCFCVFASRPPRPGLWSCFGWR